MGEGSFDGVPHPFFAIFAQESTSETVQLKTGQAGVESGSMQK